MMYQIFPLLMHFKATSCDLLDLPSCLFLFDLPFGTFKLAHVIRPIPLFCIQRLPEFVVTNDLKSFIIPQSLDNTYSAFMYCQTEFERGLYLLFGLKI